MSEIRTVCGRDAVIYIDGKKLLQAQSAELRQIADIHRVRECFCSDDKAHIRKRSEYKLNLVGLRFLRPFENCNFADLDGFESVLELDNTVYKLGGCMWDDYTFAVNRENMKEHISITALTLEIREE